MPKPPQKKASALSSDDLWDLLKPRIDDYWRVGKFFLWVLVGIVSALLGGFTFLAGALLKSDNFRDTLVASIVSLDKLLTHSKDKTVFYDQINEYFKTKNLVTVFDDPAINIPLKIRAQGYLTESFSATLRNLVINNSFSTSFQLSDTRRTYNMRFLKPEGSVANIECGTVYTTSAARRNVHTTLNGEIPHNTVAPFPEDRVKSGSSYQGGVKIPLNEPNSKYFTKPSSDPDSMAIGFAVEADQPFEGTIFLDCTVAVTGSARLAQVK
jgi:hypothetical protein